MPPVLATFGPRLVAGSVLLVLLLMGNIVVWDYNTRALYRHGQAVIRTHNVIAALDEVLISALDAETGQRGYLITGRDEYLQPYAAALSRVDAEVNGLVGLVQDNPTQVADVAELRNRLSAALQLLQDNLELQRSQGAEAARAAALGGHQMVAMDAVRTQVRQMQEHESRTLAARAEESRARYHVATFGGLATGSLGVLMTLAFVWSVRRSSGQQAFSAAALHAERELLRVTLSSIGDGVIATDPRGKVTSLNVVAEQLTGWTRVEAAGTPLDHVFTIVSEETRQRVENPVTRALHDGIMVGLTNHTLLIAKDGTERPIADSAAPIRGVNGDVLGAVLVFRDVTDDRNTEIALNHSLAREQSWAERLRQVAAASLTINAAATQDSIVGVIDGEARRILGAGRCKVVFDEADIVEEDGSLVVALKSRAGRRMGYIHCTEKASGRFDDDDRAVLTQMAQMASIALENSRLYKEIRNNDVRKDEFLATLAHELRNPLAPISNSLQVLRTTDDASLQADSRAIIERQVAQLVHLVDDLLDVSRVSRGKLELRRHRVRLADVLRAAMETSRPAVDAQQHTLHLRQPSDDVWLDADLTRLAQVFANLLNNSAKYMGPGGTITVDANASADEVVVSVRDTGIGIAPEMLPYVFDMFVQADRSLERAQGGLGIGLTLVRRLVELHHGLVTVRSEGPGKGSEFVVRLPRLAAGEDEATTAPAAGSTGLLPARRILVVDDNKDAVDSLSLLLTIVGQTVASAHDGIEALSQVERFGPEVVVLDIGLPGLNGYEVARRIRSMEGGRRVVLVALTGWGQDEDRRRTVEAGFDHHLVKPVDFDALKALLAGLPRGN
ncbi:MAG: CHASE3 domain-containing protein [Vicinamibacteria bacterium]|nr:CHASE3 domain-containing protein [Vicinamibacteria bacterium]